MENPVEPADSNEGLVDGRYRLQKLLGQGGMGSVHLALDESTGQQVALKRLLADGASDLLVTLFEREYRALASLRHPRIVRVYEYGVDPAGPYYTMEVLEGDDLSKAAPMPWREACSCLRDAASILGVLHARRLIHRDLNPRNLWRTPDGRVKLLDFGALAHFGVASEVVGAPPLIAPESMKREALDGRTDLYTLGALGYWLLTRNHAFPARSAQELPGLWQRAPARPSTLVHLIKDVDHDVPPALDDLVLALMRVDPDERPPRTADVIDTLNDAASLPAESRDVVVSGYLENAAFVGREKLRSHVERSVDRAGSGKTTAHFVTSPSGMGRSRLLAELALSARLSGASVVELRAREGGGPYALAIELCRRLLGVLPRAGRQAAQTFATELRGLSEGLAALIEPAPDAPSKRQADRNQERVERQNALAEFVGKLALDHTLMLTVDDVHLADQESLALLAELADGESGHRLVLVTSIVEERVETGLTTLGKWRESSKRWSLQGLSADETRELMGSLFGEIPLLERFSARLHQASDGRPDHLMMLVRHLISTGDVRYAEGTWMLPLDLPTDLPASVDAGALMQLEQADANARSLAMQLAVPDHAPLDQAVVRALWKGDPKTLAEALTQLVDLGVLWRAPEGVYMPHAALREQLWSELDGETQRRVHRTLAGALQQEDGVLRLARAALHHVRAGDVEAAQPLLAQTVRNAFALADAGTLRVAVPALEDIEECLRKAGVESHLRVPALAGLGMAGYLVDGAYAVKYGEEAQRVLEEVLYMPLARRLRPFMGRKLALGTALLRASTVLKSRRSELEAGEVIQWFVTMMSSMAGTMASYIDAEAVRRYANALEPFAGLGPDHVASFARRYGLALAYGGEDRPYLSLTAMQECRERLEAPKPIKGLAPMVGEYMVGGCLFSNGIRMCLAARREALDLAEQLARIGTLQDMQADYVRSYYYATQGDVERAREFRQRLEGKAVRLGNCWQAEVTGPNSEMALQVFMHDAAAVKRTTRAVEALAARIPSLRPNVPRGKTAYAHMRDRNEEALELAEAVDVPPLALVGWGQHRGVVAAAYNRLGQHERARDVCIDVLERLQPEDLDFVLLNLNLRLELEIAEAALGQREAAQAKLEAMLDAYHDRGPLIRGYVLRALVRMAKDADDHEAFEAYLGRMKKCYEPLRLPSLHSVCARHEAELRELRNPGQGVLASELLESDSHLHTRVNLVLTQAGTMCSERAAVGIQLAVDLAHASGGCVIQMDCEQPLATTGVELDASAVGWGRERLQGTADDDVTAVDSGLTAADDPPASTLEVGEATYTLTMLWHPGSHTPVAALLLRFAEEQPRPLPDALQRALARGLWEAQADSGIETHAEPSARGA